MLLWLDEIESQIQVPHDFGGICWEFWGFAGVRLADRKFVAPNCFKGHRVVETPLPRQAHPQIRRGPCMSAYPARKIVCACSPV